MKIFLLLLGLISFSNAGSERFFELVLPDFLEEVGIEDPKTREQIMKSVRLVGIAHEIQKDSKTGRYKGPSEPELPKDPFRCFVYEFESDAEKQLGFHFYMGREFDPENKITNTSMHKLDDEQYKEFLAYEEYDGLQLIGPESIVAPMVDLSLFKAQDDLVPNPDNFVQVLFLRDADHSYVWRIMRWLFLQKYPDFFKCSRRITEGSVSETDYPELMVKCGDILFQLDYSTRNREKFITIQNNQVFMGIRCFTVKLTFGDFHPTQEFFFKENTNLAEIITQISCQIIYNTQSLIVSDTHSFSDLFVLEVNGKIVPDDLFVAYANLNEPLLLKSISVSKKRSQFREVRILGFNGNIVSTLFAMPIRCSLGYFLATVKHISAKCPECDYVLGTRNIPSTIWDPCDTWDPFRLLDMIDVPPEICLVKRTKHEEC